MAAQPIVSIGFNKLFRDLNTNIIGTANLLLAAAAAKKLKTIIVVTSDKCYEPNYSKRLNELDKIGGIDPYSASKGACEIITRSISKSYLKKK